jgi:hypothetical protein
VQSIVKKHGYQPKEIDGSLLIYGPEPAAIEIGNIA